MTNWILRWNFDRPNYEPGDSGRMDFWLQNSGDTYLYLSEVGVQFEHQINANRFWPASKPEQVVKPRNTQYLSSATFTLPMKAGIELYRVYHHLWQYNSVLATWHDLSVGWSEFSYYVSVLPRPRYSAFVSRGLRVEDRFAGDPIVKMIEHWGFECTTVGIDKFTMDPYLLSEEIKTLVLQSDCLIAIATPRYLDALTGLWRTLEWLHGEVGIAFGTEKPVLVLRDEQTSLGGLPGELRAFSVPFNPLDNVGLWQRLGAIMPAFREAIVTKRSNDLLEELKKGIPPLIVGGIFGYLVAKNG